jgi:hypothetical protein
MRTKQNKLLAGVAALALFAASGIAMAQQGTAQQGQQDQKGAGSAAQHSMQRGEPGGKNQGSNLGANQGAKNQGANNQSASQGMKNQSAQRGGDKTMSRQSAGQNAHQQGTMQSRSNAAGNAAKGEKSRSAQELRGNKRQSAADRTGQERQRQFNAQSRTQSKSGQFANEQRSRAQRAATSAQRNEQLKGLQGSTRAPMQGTSATEQRGGGAANVSLNEQQRTRIRETVINSRSARRVSNVDFSVNVGTVVPRGHIHLVRVPETLIRIEPRWRRYMYFVYNNEIVIVDPRSMRIVDVLPV